MIVPKSALGFVFDLMQELEEARVACKKIGYIESTCRIKHLHAMYEIDVVFTSHAQADKGRQHNYQISITNAELTCERSAKLLDELHREVILAFKQMWSRSLPVLP